MVIKRRDIYYADLRPVVGSEQGGIRPVLIIQNDVGNRHSPTVMKSAWSLLSEKRDIACTGQILDESMEKCYSLQVTMHIYLKGEFKRKNGRWQ